MIYEKQYIQFEETLAKNLVVMIAIKDFQLQANFSHKISFSDISSPL